jgi:FkbM family methyltransferase
VAGPLDAIGGILDRMEKWADELADRFTDRFVAAPARTQRLLSKAAREYVLHSPLPYGKGRVITAVRRLPAGAREFDVSIPEGVLRLRWDEVIGRKTLSRRLIEIGELDAARAYTRRGGCAIDVGANIGLFTVPLACAVGAHGTVIAVEPLTDNVAQLQANIERNQINNVRVISAAAAASDGTAPFNVAGDPAFGSLATLVHYRQLDTVIVPTRTLDSIWTDAGEPDVQFVKIDVEGAQLDVIAGADELLNKCSPVLLVEADPGADAASLSVALEQLDYWEGTPTTFEPQNHLFIRGRA